MDRRDAPGLELEDSAAGNQPEVTVGMAPIGEIDSTQVHEQCTDLSESTEGRISQTTKELQVFRVGQKKTVTFVSYDQHSAHVI